jgi:hypothetical protein
MVAALALCACSGSPAANQGAALFLSTHSSAIDTTSRPFVTNLALNGSFEHPTVALGGYTGFSTGQTFNHWLVTGAAGNVAVVSGTFTQNGFTFPAGCGKQWLDLTGVSNSATGVQQSIATKAGTKYTVAFDVGNVYDPGGIFGTTSTVNVLIDGVQTFSGTNKEGKGKTTQVWRHFSFAFTATTATTTITFLNGDPSTDTSNGLDCVSMT